MTLYLCVSIFRFQSIIHTHTHTHREREREREIRENEPEKERRQEDVKTQRWTERNEGTDT